MTTDIKELVKEARSWHAGHSDDSQRVVWLMNKLSDALEALAGEVEQAKAKATSMQRWIDHHNERADKAEAERDRLAGEVDKLQMKLAACGTGALANTERTVAQRITKESPYWSASLGDVYHIVDKEMEARAERDRLKAALVRLGTHINISAGERLMIVQEALGGDAS